MANNYNLIPGAHKLTVEEQSRGGQRSGEVRREKQQLRQIVNEVLTGVYEVKGSGELTGAEIITKGIVEVLKNPYHKDWFKVVQLFVKLTDSEKTELELETEEAKRQRDIENSSFLNFSIE